VALANGLTRQMVEDDRRIRQIVEDGLDRLEEEWQPMLHAGKAPALADRGVERVVARGGAEKFDVVAAEAAYRLGGQRDLAHRLEPQLAPLACRALRGRIEGADRFQRVAEEIEPQRLFRTGREKVENAAAHRILADIAHRWHALEAARLQPCYEIVHVDLVAGLRAQRLSGDEIERRHLL
jgi:hypothetical protein